MTINRSTTEYENLPALCRAFDARDFAIAAQLIAEGARLDEIIFEDGNTFLHDAAQDADMEMVEFYLSHDCPLSLESFDYIDQTPLIRAANHGNTEVVARLLAARVNPNANNEEKIGNTAIREAVNGGHVEIVSLLLQAGADPTIPGWVGLSAVDMAWYEVKGSPENMQKIRDLLSAYPSSVRDRYEAEQKRKD
jgi:ankyrin repeat protein